jgi:hypothetical protein
MRKAFLVLGFLLSFATAMSGFLQAQCYGSLMLASDFFEFDHIVRLGVHFGEASSVPNDIVCSRSMLPGETALDVPIFAYNLHEGITYLEFSVVSNESLAVFVPDNCFSVVASDTCHCDSEYRIDLAIQACGSVCGPARIGTARIVRIAGSDPVWIDLRPNGQTGKMFALDTYGHSCNAYSPQHGGFVGQDYLYACQESICEEPNAPVTAFAAKKNSGCSVQLTWVAGSGNRTMVRFRTDQYPTGYADGQLAFEVRSTAGEHQYFLHTDVPQPATIYYKAFSLTRDASDLITRASFVECSSVDTIWMKCEIGVDAATWGAIKSLFR